MTDEERLARRVRFARAMQWKHSHPEATEEDYALDCPDPDNDPAALLSLLEWTMRNTLVEYLAIETMPQRRIGCTIQMNDAEQTEIVRSADTLTEALLCAVDAALLGRKE